MISRACLIYMATNECPNCKILQTKVSHLEEQVDALRSRLDQLIRHRFGARSERFEDGDDPQCALFPELIDESGCSGKPGNSSKDSKKGRQNNKSKSQKKRLTYPNNLKVIENRIGVDETNLQCLCGKHMRVFGQEITDRLAYQPESFYIEREIRDKLGCSCGQGICSAKACERILPKLQVANSLLAQVIIAKCLDRQPFYHLEKRYLARHNVAIPRDNMARWTIMLGQALQPIYNFLCDQISEYDIASLDATWLQVLKENGRLAQTRSKAWCFIGGPPEQEVVLFEYNDQDHTGFIQSRLEGFKGKLHGDADNCYTNLGQTMSYCNAHSRRHYEPIAKASKSKGIANYVMTQYQALYAVEEEIKDKTAVEKHQIRQQKAKPIADNLKDYLVDKLIGIPPKSKLGEAVNYTLKYWDGLTRYLDDGRLSIDNNHTERLVRQFVLARNNFLFADSVAGAKALCLHMSLIQTAVKHGMEPYAYYVKLMNDMPKCTSVEDYERLLPWNINNEKNMPVAA